MRPPKQKPDETDHVTFRDTFRIIYFFARVYATCLIVFSRHTFGAEALGWHGFWAFVLILLCAGFGEAPEMLDFLKLWLAALILQRIRTFVALRKGRRLHSFYGGEIWFESLVPFVKSHGRAAALEFLAWSMIGLWLTQFSEALGRFVFYGAWSLVIVYVIERQAIVMEIRRMRDAEIEMQMRTEMYRDPRNF